MIALLWHRQILLGKKTLEQVPRQLRDAVQQLLQNPETFESESV